MKNSIGSVLVCVGISLLGIGLAEASEIEKGKAFYEEKRCSLCHMIAGKGGQVGPDLSGIGSRRDRAWLLKFFDNPKKVANANMMPVKGSTEELSALAAYLLSQK